MGEHPYKYDSWPLHVGLRTWTAVIRASVDSWLSPYNVGIGANWRKTYLCVWGTMFKLWEIVHTAQPGPFWPNINENEPHPVFTLTLCLILSCFVELGSVLRAGARVSFEDKSLAEEGESGALSQTAKTRVWAIGETAKHEWFQLAWGYPWNTEWSPHWLLQRVSRLQAVSLPFALVLFVNQPKFVSFCFNLNETKIFWIYVIWEIFLICIDSVCN